MPRLWRVLWSATRWIGLFPPTISAPPSDVGSSSSVLLLALNRIPASLFLRTPFIPLILARPWPPIEDLQSWLRPPYSHWTIFAVLIYLLILWEFLFPISRIFFFFPWSYPLCALPETRIQIPSDLPSLSFFSSKLTSYFCVWSCGRAFCGQFFLSPERKITPPPRKYDDFAWPRIGFLSLRLPCFWSKLFLSSDLPARRLNARWYRLPPPPWDNLPHPLSFAE